MKKTIAFLSTLAALGALPAGTTLAEPIVWGVQVEQLEHRLGEASGNILAWDFDAFVGNDDLKLVWRSEAEYETGPGQFEALENQARLQFPVSDFFDGVMGIRVENPKSYDRVDFVAGLHGLTKQWFEIDADLFLSQHPSARFEIEYEGLITNRITLTPSFEVDLPFTDDSEKDVGAWGMKTEIGARLSYDLVDRLFSPYIGVHYERSFGETERILSAEGEASESVYLVTGMKIMF